MSEPLFESHMRAKHIFHSFYFAWQGILYALKTQRNFKIHLCFAFMALVLAIALNVSLIEWLIVVTLIGLVLFAELMNTAMELTVDWLSQGKYIKAVRHIKDIAAGAVFITALSALACGILIFFPKLCVLLHI